MKIKRLLLLLEIALIALLTQCNQDQIDFVEISDDAFLNALIEEGIDTNGDGLISSDEAEAVISLNVSSQFWVEYEMYIRDKIKSMDGIEAFVNLDSLSCFINDLTSLDVTNCKSLKYLDCGENQLNSLDVSYNAALEYLSCRNNQLSRLDITNNIALSYLDCDGNGITSLDISNNKALEHLRCGNNQQSILDISNNTSLVTLYCHDNQLPSLDVSGSADLEILVISGNQLSSLNVSNNTILEYLIIDAMPSLNEVCVWELPFPPDGVIIDTTGSPNVYFTTECSK